MIRREHSHFLGLFRRVDEQGPEGQSQYSGEDWGKGATIRVVRLRYHGGFSPDSESSISYHFPSGAAEGW